MRKMAIAAALVFTSAAAFAQDVKTDYDRSANFDAIKTFAVKIGTSWNNQISEKRITDEIAQTLTEKGWKQVDASPDALVLLHGATEKQKSLNTFYSGMGGYGGYGYRGWGGMGGMGTATTTTSEYLVGTLVVDIFDAKTKALMFRGTERQDCAADTSKGVILAKSVGEAPCLLGKTWGYDDKGIWVAEGCSAVFIVGPQTAVPPEVTTKKPLQYIPNAGFLLVEGDKGEMYVRLFSYVRYLNQKGLDTSYKDYFGNTHTVPQRQDVQLNKFFLPFSGWFLTPKFRYYLYVWSANTAQGDPAQVVGGGNLSYTFNRYISLGGGITSLPSVRSTEGQFPYWLGIDDRLTSDEFFRGSYTTGFWLKGELSTKVKYMAMLANNLSTLGVSAAQIDNKLDTTSFMLQWLPTTGEFGLYGTFGDYDYHEKVATRLAGHYTHSTEDKQSQPGADTIENSQIRLTDGSVIFTPDLFGPGIIVQKVKYQMSSVDAGIKYKGLSLEAEYYWRWLSDFQGINTGGIADINDHGFQVQSSAMPVPKTLQVYLSGAAIRGHYGNSSEVRAGFNWYVVEERGLRLNAEWIHLNKCPVGYTAVPYPVGGNGDVFHTNFEMNF